MSSSTLIRREMRDHFQSDSSPSETTTNAISDNPGIAPTSDRQQSTTTTTTRTTRTAETRGVEMTVIHNWVDAVLQSPWGRRPSRRITHEHPSVLHQWLDQIRPSHTSSVPGTAGAATTAITVQQPTTVPTIRLNTWQSVVMMQQQQQQQQFAHPSMMERDSDERSSSSEDDDDDSDGASSSSSSSSLMRSSSSSSSWSRRQRQRSKHHAFLVPSMWDVIEQRCRTHPCEAYDVDRRGRTCLHVACTKQPTLAAIRAIVHACGRHGEIVMERDKHGQTPLALAIVNHADWNVVQWLLQQSPEAARVSDHLGHVPLHLAAAGYQPVTTTTTTKTPDATVLSPQVALVRTLLAIYLEGARRESYNGRTPLHVAAEARTSIDIVQPLVNAYPAAVIKEGCGLNPLFLAIHYNSSADVIQCLVRACPTSTLTRAKDRGMPLRWAIEHQSSREVQSSLCTCPQVVFDADQYMHNTALHTALECGTAQVGMVELLVQTAPGIALTRNKLGQTPLSLACQKWIRIRSSTMMNITRQQQQQQQQQQNHPHHQDPRGGGGVDDDDDDHNGGGAVDAIREVATVPVVATRTDEDIHVQQMWCILVLLLRAAFYGVHYTNTKLAPTLHAAMSLPLPLRVVLHALDRYGPDETRLMDLQGRYPLDLAIGFQPTKEYTRTLYCVDEYLRQREQTILSVLKHNPAAAALRNRDGRYAICVAASERSISFRVLQALWTAYPLALEKMDPFTQLFPYQIAALKRDPVPALATIQATNEWHEREDLMHLDAIYLLLKQAPDLIRYGQP